VCDCEPLQFEVIGPTDTVVVDCELDRAVWWKQLSQYSGDAVRDLREGRMFPEEHVTMGDDASATGASTLRHMQRVVP
jgi:hypothetical protein